MAHRAPPGIAEGRVAVVGSGSVADALGDGLRRYGLAVAVIPTATEYDETLAAAEAAIGQLDAIVWVETSSALATPAPILALDEAEWGAAVGDSLRSYVAFLQAAQRKLQGLGGRIVVLVPTIATSGAAHHVAWSTVAEGQRALAKSVARTWGESGIRVNCVAVPTSLLAPTGEERAVLQRSALDAPRIDREVAGVVASLCSEAMAGVTGTTIGVDGGQWMPS